MDSGVVIQSSMLHDKGGFVRVAEAILLLKDKAEMDMGDAESLSHVAVDFAMKVKVSLSRLDLFVLCSVF